jgi:hypothetical protein
MAVEIFDGRDADHNDDAYGRWVADHPSGYIINTNRNINPRYMALHRSRCDDVTNPRRYEPGAYTERQYAKVCGDSRSGLVDWLRQHGRPDGSFTSEECLCNRD